MCSINIIDIAIYIFFCKSNLSEFYQELFDITYT